MNEEITAEKAYFSLAGYLIDFINSRHWQQAGVSAEITRSAVTLLNHWLMQDGEVNEKAMGWGSSEIRNNAMEAVRYLRDNLLATSGQRIWGLTFTLYPDGKFNIEYDYNKPEDYEETDEVITGDEINESLTGLINKPESK